MTQREKDAAMSKIDKMAQKAYPISENMDLSYKMADAGLQLAYRQGANAVLSEIEKYVYETPFYSEAERLCLKQVLCKINELKGKE